MPPDRCCTINHVDTRCQELVVFAGALAGVVCAAAALQLSKFWPLATAAWLVALACATALAAAGSGWRRRAGIALLIAALLAVLAFFVFVGLYFYALRDL